jgi:ABC-2 type transport system permease protein
MIPVFLIGDIIIIARFGCSIFQAIMILIGSIVLPLVSETIGIIINLKYPKMDASSDTEVVKQSLSSTIAVFIGMGLIGVTAFGIYSLFARSVHSDIIMAVVLGVYILIYLGLWIYLKKTSVKRFNEINT